jgi:hypothetical protein
VDEATVRNHAEQHGRAIVEGNLGRAAEDLTDPAKGQAGAVMKALPRPVTGVEVAGVRMEGDEAVVLVRYMGESADTSVESRWADEGGRPMITALRLLE